MKKNYYHKLNKANQENIVQVFKDFCQKIFQEIDNNKLSIEKGSFIIAGTMFMDLISRNEKLEDIALCAGELELPPRYLSKAQDVLYKEIKELVDQL